MNIPTAEEFLKQYNNHDHSKSEGCSCRYRDIVALKEFAKLHVEAALEAKIKAMAMKNFYNDGYDLNELDAFTKNAYPLTNIK